MSGQHTFSACRVIRERAEAEGRTPPSWTLKFTCRKIRSSTSVDLLETIAGREQARTGTVKQQKLSDRLRQFLVEEERHKDQPVSTNELLVKVYRKGSCVRATEGGVVHCPPPLPQPLVLPLPVPPNLSPLGF